MGAPQLATPRACGLVDELSAFRANGRTTDRGTAGGVPYFFNEFWTAKQRQAHSLHEISYRACFKPQLPAFFISRLTNPGDVVYDPFMGRGTAPLEAALMGRAAVGADVNPLSVYLVRPRLAPPALSAIERRLSEIDWRGDGDARRELLAFYHRDTLREICALRRHFLEHEDAGAIDAADDWIRMVALNRLTGHSPGFFSVYTLPPNQAVSAAAQRKINEKRGQTPPYRCVRTLILRKSRALLRDSAPPATKARVLTASATHTPELKEASVDLVVTSPPFLDIVQYASDNWLRCWFAGIDHRRVVIASHRKVADWTRFIAEVFTELARIVRPGGHVAFEVGEVRNGSVKLEAQVVEAIGAAPFDPLCVLVNVQRFTKTANCWGVSNNAKGTNTNRVVVLRRR